MNVNPLLAEAKDLARVVGTHEDSTVLAMLTAAAGDVLHAAGVTAPESAAELAGDLRHAICDQAAAMYDLRGDVTSRPGLTVAASRVVARYRGVSLGAADAE